MAKSTLKIDELNVISRNETAKEAAVRKINQKLKTLIGVSKESVKERYGLASKDMPDWETLNELVGKKHSVPYKDFYAIMQLSDGQKKVREDFAELLYAVIEPELLMIYTYVQSGVDIDWSFFKDMMKIGLISVIQGKMEVDEYINDHVEYITEEFIKSTQNHIEEPYYLSQDRAMFFAEDESNHVYEYDTYRNAVNAGKTTHTWLKTTVPPKTREAHQRISGTTLPINEPFVLDEVKSGGTVLMRFPGDTMYKPSAYQLVNCRCVAEYN